MTAG
jgi:hypothetical protein